MPLYSLETVVEAENADIAKTLVQNAVRPVEVSPEKRYRVVVEMPVTFRFDMTVRAGSPEEAETNAIHIIQCEEIEWLLRNQGLAGIDDYECDIDGLEVEQVEDLDDVADDAI